MSDDQWVRSVNNKNIYTGGQVRGGTVRADGRLSTGENLQLDGVNTAGAGCSPNGQVSRDSSGAILSCVNGVWKTPAITESTTTYGDVKCNNKSGQTIAYCPSGFRLMSGGFEMTQWTNDDAGRNSPDSSFPSVSANAWVVTPPGSFGGCVRAVAYCAR